MSESCLYPKVSQTEAEKPYLGSTSAGLNIPGECRAFITLLRNIILCCEDYIANELTLS